MRCKMLLKLADHLETRVDDRHFDMTVFGRKSPCGTVACAFGSAPTCFPRSKLKLHLGDYSGWVSYTDTNGWESHDYEAAVHFFDLQSLDDATYLFSPNRYPKSHRSRRYVSRRIRTFVKNYQKLKNK